MNSVTCNQNRELISSAIDGELCANEQLELDAHLASCASCATFQSDAWDLHRSLHVHAVDAPSHATDEPMRVAIVGDVRSHELLRWTLFVIGATLIVLNAQALLGLGAESVGHLSRHDGVFGTALGIGMIAVAAKPHRAIGLVPLTSSIAVLMTVAAVADLASGQASMLAEAIHVVEFAGLLCLWVISGGPVRMQERLGSLSHRFGARHAASV